MPAGDAFRLAMMHSSVGMCRVGRDGAFLEVNPALCSMLGRDAETLLRCSWQQLTHPDDLSADLALVQSVIAGTRQAYHLRKRYLRPDGSVVHGELSVVGVLAADGSLDYFVSQIVDVTELVEIGERYQAVVESVSDVVSLGDNEGVIQWVLPSIQKALGWSPAEVENTPFVDLVHPDDRLTVAGVQQHLLAGSTDALEVRLRSKSGDYRWMNIRIRPVRDEHDRVVGRAASWWDVNAEHETRLALDETRERYRAAIESELDPHVFIAAVRDNTGCLVDFRYVDANLQAERYFGRGVEQLRERSLLEAYPGQRTSGLFDHYVKTVESGEPLQLDALQVRSEILGSERWFDFRGIKVADGLSLTWRDVTERVLAARALTESESHYRLLAENASDVVFQGSPEAVLLWASPSIRDVLGRPAETYIGQSVASFIHPDDIATMRAASAQVNAGERISYRARIDSAQGWRWAEVTAKPVYDATGAVVARVGSFRDVHQQVLAELALAESETAARDLAVRYELARDAAERASGQKTAFLSRMSHELRTPLNAVLGFGQLLEEEELTADQRDSLEQILIGGRHLLDLINEILDISRIESGRLALSLESVAVADAVREAISLVRTTAARSSIAIADIDTLGCTAFVFADRQRFIQILLNLLTNAIKYNRPGGRVWVTCGAGAEGMFSVQVHDTGIGMSPAQLDRLFEPFERLGAEASGIEGTGIGLSLAEGLARTMGGSIHVTSLPGEGSTFTLSLPEAAAPEHAQLLEEAPPESTTSTSGRVLYIEDNPANRLLMQRIFEQRPDRSLEVAATGAEGLLSALERPPDLVLLDLHLPDMSGEEVLLRLRTDSRTHEVPVLIVTADAATMARRNLKALGAADVLTKPVVVREVLSWVDDPKRTAT